jgi:hypothetical protein
MNHAFRGWLLRTVLVRFSLLFCQKKDCYTTVAMKTNSRPGLNIHDSDFGV